jgi:hypothetical protein
MAQVSRPLQILLVAAVLFGAVYMVALRPKSDSGGSSTPAKPASHATTSPAQGPGGSIPGGLGRAVTKARGAAGQSDAANQRVQQASGGGSTSTPAATPASGRAAAASPAARGAQPAQRPVATPKATSSSAAVSAAVAHGKVVVLLFWNRQASDDRSVRAELAHVSSHGGKALIVAAPVRQVSLFSSSIRGIQVLQSPTIIVVDRRHRARTLVGYTDRTEIGQAVDQALAGR